MSTRPPSSSTTFSATTGRPATPPWSAELRPRWEKEAERFIRQPAPPNGLFPKEQYCGDICTPVQSLNVNPKAWRALRDLGALLAEAGRSRGRPALRRRGGRIRAGRPRAPSTRASAAHTTPPFVPIALDGGEPVHDPILHYRIGGYWNIIIGYTIGSGIFPPGSEEETWIPRYQEQHGGIFLGMVTLRRRPVQLLDQRRSASTRSTAPATPSTPCAATTRSAPW